MASSPLFDDLTPDFACPVCLQWFREPVALPCGHLYCRACIETVWGAPKIKLSCPQCRKQFPEKRYTPCKLLGTLIHRIRGMNPEEAEEGRPREVSCKEPVPSQNQTLLSVHETITWYKEDLSLAIVPLESKLNRFLMLKGEEDERLQNHQAVILSLGDHICAEFKKLHHFLHAQEEAWKVRLEEEGRTLLRATEERLTTLRKSCQETQELLLEAQRHLQLQDSAGFLMGIHTILNRVKQQQATVVIPDMPPLMRILGQFKGPLQYVAWREMKSALDIEFPQITLDPGTAHPCLVLSDDHTCVRDGHLRRDIPDTPMRFNYCVAVLGCQGFSSGQHYWEVEVDGKPSWTLGLVYFSVNRKGKIAASPDNGYWVIRLRNGEELMAKDTPPQRLCPTSFPRRVGVYLDYEAGLVSFYDASILVHLYTFTVPRFLETLLPYFCPGLYNAGENATLLKICHLALR